MLLNQFRTAIRALRRRLGYSLINVFGLALGLACCLLIGLYVQHHLRFDRHHENAERIVRVATVFNDRDPVAVTPNILGPTLEQTFPDVEATVRLDRVPNRLVRHDGRVQTENDFYYADPSVTDVFTMPFVAGTPEGALTRPETMVLTASTARRYFDSPQDAVGQTLSVNDAAFTVTGVIEDAPETSHLRYDFLASSASRYWSKQDNWIWGSANYNTYALLQSGTNPAALEAKIADLVQERIGERMKQAGFSIAYVLQPLPRIHLYVNGHVTYVYLFGSIAALILLVACINFVNLSTARSTERAREVGVRKTLGAERGGLVRQFLVEATTLSVGAGGLALLIAEATLPAFESLAQADLAASVLGEGPLVAALLGSAVVTGLLAGAYPAFALSRFQPARVLKSAFDAQPEGRWLRRGLVTTQFVVSMVLIVGTLVVSDQLGYVQSKNLGFDREHVAVLPLMGSLDQDYPTLRAQLRGVTGVKHVAPLSSLPGENHGGYRITRPGSDETLSSVTGLATGPGILDALGLTLLAGDGMPTSAAYDVEASGTPFIINETLMSRLGWTPQEALGKEIQMHGREGRVRGVVKDFHVASLRTQIDPVALFIESGRGVLDHAVVRLDGTRIAATMDGVEQVWSQMLPGTPFAYSFLDDTYDALYRAEQRTGRVLGIIAGLALLVSCLGLLGLAAYTVQRRMKEIGVRKVLGATVPQLLALLSKDVLVLVGVAFALAAPLAYLGAQQWLSQFAYATGVSPSAFVIAGVATAGLAIATIAAQSLQAARRNPADILQAE